jgi:hypothetical protein
MSPESASNRLERMEEKLDRLSEAIVALARVESQNCDLRTSICAQLRTFVALETRTLAHNCAQLVLRDLKPPFRSPHLLLPELVRILIQHT